MRWRICAAAVLCAVGMLSTACDDKPEVPQAVLDQSKANEHKGPSIPTTQELLTATRRRIALLPLPLTMMVPPGWDKLNDNNVAGISVSSAGLNILQGYTPGGEVQLQLASRSPMKQEELDRMLVAGKAEMAKKPQQIVKFELRTQGNLKILERQSVGPPAPLTVYDKDNQPHTSTESIFNWTLSTLIPAEGAYQVCEINFIGLTKSQYDNDKDFLTSILDTLHYAGDAGSASLSTATSGATSALTPAATPTGTPATRQ